LNDVSKPALPGRAEAAIQLVTHLLVEREAERGRLARMLHRDVSGMLAAARMDLSRVAARNTQEAEAQQLLQRVDQLLEQAIRDARQEMQRLHPALLDHFGLPAALRHLVEETCRGGDIRYTLALDEPVDGLEGSLAIAVYRLFETVLGEPGLAQFDARLTVRRGVHEIAITRRFAPGSTPGSARGMPALAALRHWLRSLGVTWTESGTDDVPVLTLRIPREPASDEPKEAPEG
jgi:type II secretory pathway pseudopilin PulG